MPAPKQPASLWCLECGAVFQVQPYRRDTAKYCSWRCAQVAKAKASAAINGPKQRFGGAGKSYVKLNGRHMHRVIAEQQLGRPLSPGEIVHHKDENKRNNSADNLQVMTQSEHTAVHRQKMLAARLAKAGY